MRTNADTQAERLAPTARPTLRLAEVAVTEVIVVTITALAATSFALAALFNVIAGEPQGAIWFVPSLLCALALVYTLRFGVRLLRRTGFAHPAELVVGGLVSAGVAALVAARLAALVNDSPAVATAAAIVFAVVAFFLFNAILGRRNGKPLPG